MDRNLRNLIQKKQERVSIKTGAPSLNDIKESAMELRFTNEGLVLYARYRNKLYQQVLGESRITSSGFDLVGVSDRGLGDVLYFNGANWTASPMDELPSTVTPLGVQNGGTGVSTLTDGGVLLGNGTGGIQATAVLADGEMLVGDGSTDPAVESGATLRTSIGVGTGDSPEFTNLTLSGDLTVNGNDINFDADDSFIKVGDSATNAPGNRLNLYAGSPETGTHADIAGGDLRLYCGKSKGTATGGNFAVYVTPSAGSPSVALNSHAIALLTRYDKSTTFYGDPILQTNQIKASDSTVAITIDTDGNVVSGGYLKPGTSLYMSKINSAQADIGNHGQLWVKNVSPVELWFTEAGGTDIQITSGTSLASNTIQVASITINQSNMNALQTTEQTIVAAQGANKIIMPTSGFLIIDRDSVTSQSSSTADLFISYDGATSLSEVIYYQRRFMYGESGDRVLHLQHYTGETAQAIADAENKPLTVKLDSAITSGSIDSMKVVISYHVFDNS